MKIRIRDNTLRVRLVQTEVASLAAGESIRQVTTFSPVASLVVEIQPTDVVTTPAADFSGSRLLVRLPRSEVRLWASGDPVGIRGTQPAGEGRTLEILVEKDFECLHPGEEKTADAYPNPGAA